jgi:hypothetical protein
MGRQINFYFDYRDEKLFLDLPQLQNVVFLRFNNIDHPQYYIYDEFDLNPQLEASHSQTCICLQNDLDKVVYSEIDDGKAYFINDITSPIIEYTRSGFNYELNLLVSGRLWFQMKYWGKDENGESALLSKSKELEKLYNSLAGWIRRHCKRLPNGNYIGPHAMELYNKGTELSP